MTMKVDSIGNTNVWAKAGPMIRETLDAGSKNAMIAVTPGSGVSFQWRDTANAAYATNSGTAGLVAPYWVRITRTGNVFKAERSADGKTWTQQGVDTTVTMGASVYIGMAVTSHDAALTTTAEISNVSATGTITGSWQDVAIGAAMPTNGRGPVVPDGRGQGRQDKDGGQSQSVGQRHGGLDAVEDSAEQLDGRQHWRPSRRSRWASATRPARRRAPPACCTSTTSGTAIRLQ